MTTVIQFSLNGVVFLCVNIKTFILMTIFSTGNTLPDFSSYTLVVR